MLGLFFTLLLWHLPKDVARLRRRGGISCRDTTQESCSVCFRVLGAEADHHSFFFVCWLVSVNLTLTRVAEEEGRAVEKLPPSPWLVGISEGTFS